MNWYKKAQKLMSLDDMPSIEDSEDQDYERAQKYFNIGHGDYSEEFGYNPDFQVWVMRDGEILKSEVFKVDEETGEAEGAGTHGSLWGHDNHTYKGRYEPQTGRLTIVRPDFAMFRDVPSEVIGRIQRAFPKATKLIVASSKSLHKKAFPAPENVKYIADYYETKGAKDLAHRFKQNDMEAIDVMAQEMAQQIPDDAILIPVPSRSGKATTTKLLAEKIKGIRGGNVIVKDVVIGKERKSLYDIKKSKLPVPEDFFGYTISEIPQGNVYLVDNVYNTGSTAKEIQKLIPHAQVLVYAYSEPKAASNWYAKVKEASLTGGTSPSPSTPIVVSEDGAASPSQVYSDYTVIQNRQDLAPSQLRKKRIKRKRRKR